MVKNVYNILFFNFIEVIFFTLITVNVYNSSGGGEQRLVFVLMDYMYYNGQVSGAVLSTMSKIQI